MYDLNDVISHVNWLQVLKTFLQIVIICYGVIWIWRRIVGTQAERLVKGLLVLIGICALSYIFGFELVNGILQRLIPIAVMALLVIFQPEIRRGLGYLGRMKTFKLDFALPNPEDEKVKNDIAQIIGAVRELSRTRVGALIVVEPPHGERDYLSPGTTVNADITSTLLLTIFFPKSPLHDGAVILRQHKIIAAGVILPMTLDPKLSYKYGTRHRAAIGLSEIYDGLCIVVSEETGSISAASRGMLVRYNNADDLADPLSYIYTQDDGESSPVQSFLNMVGRKGENAESEAAQVPVATAEASTPGGSMDGGSHAQSASISSDQTSSLAASQPTEKANAPTASTPLSAPRPHLGSIEPEQAL
ncbi:MAG TPA: diadenylate cyclase CdaA [Chroococcales cyanobacterium]